MNSDELASKILENHANHIEICGLYGLKDENLIEPTNPDCELVITFKYYNYRLIYVIEKEIFLQIDMLDKVMNRDLPKLNYDNFKQKILDYIDSDKIVVEKESLHSTFKKMIMPMMRRTFPSLSASSLVSVQPMTTPTGLAEYLKTQKNVE